MTNGNAVTFESAEQKSLAPVVAETHSLCAAGRYGDALALIAKALACNPGDSELLFARATVLFDWGRIWEAREGFLEAETNGLSRIALYLNLGWSCNMLGLPEDAERYIRTAIAIDPESVDAHCGLGSILQSLERFEDAIASYLTALELAPRNAQFLTSLGACKAAQKDYVGAEEYARRALTLEPDRPQALANFGIALAMQERYKEGLEVLSRAADAEAALRASGENFVNYGYALMLTGQMRAAAEFHRRNLPALPDPSVHRQYSFALLTLGHLREGWDQHEFRWYEEPNLSKRPNFAQPPWVGQNLADKTILLRSEQGAGDIMQFARYAALLKKMGATVILQVPDDLRDLADGFAGVDRAVAQSMPVPAFDFHISVMSVPAVLATELSTIPAEVPYLRIDPTKMERWETQIEGRGLKIGLAWAGNPAHLRDRYRSIPFDALSTFWEIPGVRYFSLQKQPRPDDVAKFPPDLTMRDLGPKFEDFGDTAAAIAQLDLIICVDTAVAHLAGALGKPVWVLLPEIGDFRWLLDRKDSPWYPTMRLFRQRRLGEWGEVVAGVKVALEEAVRTGSLAGPPPATIQLDDFDVGVEAPIEADALTEIPTAISRVTEARYGIMQYVPNDDVTARSIAWYGEFLQPHVELLARMIGPDDRLIEVGSGIGAHAIPLAKMLGPRGHLFLYETRPVLRRILQQNLAANRVTQSTTLMRRAVSGASDTPEDSETLDELLLDRLDLLKIQADAAADNILVGASDTLWRLRPKLFISVPDDRSLADCVHQAKAYGYRCWRMESAYFNAGNFYRRDTNIFGGQRSLALLALPEEVDVTIALEGCVELTDASNRRDMSLPAPLEPIQGSMDSDAGGGEGRPGLLRKLRNLIR